MSLQAFLKRPGAPAGLVAPKSRIEKMAAGFRFVEGPLWLAEENCLLFSDIPANKIYRLTTSEKRGAHRVEIFREPSGKSNGLTRDKSGCLLICEHSGRRVSRLDSDGTLRNLAGEFEGKKLNSPNDIVVKSDGAIYFTDPLGGIRPEEQEQPFQGVYRIPPEGGQLQLLATDFAMPNGLAFSPDESVLYIGDSSPRSHIRSFDVRPDGLLENGKELCFLPGGGAKGARPDGIKVDTEGRIYCAAQGGIKVFDPVGKHLGTIHTPEQPANCAWGGPSRSMLYITARTSIYRIQLTSRGAGML